MNGGAATRLWKHCSLLGVAGVFGRLLALADFSGAMELEMALADSSEFAKPQPGSSRTNREGLAEHQRHRRQIDRKTRRLLQQVMPEVAYATGAASSGMALHRDNRWS
jgi:hypothetical protein